MLYKYDNPMNNFERHFAFLSVFYTFFFWGGGDGVNKTIIPLALAGCEIIIRFFLLLGVNQNYSLTPLFLYSRCYDCCIS